jgi:hypothetical protein
MSTFTQHQKMTQKTRIGEGISNCRFLRSLKFGAWYRAFESRNIRELWTVFTPVASDSPCAG